LKTLSRAVSTLLERGLPG